MKHSNCLNCGKELNDLFCSRCGQKADTHRISFKHFLFHDLLHGTFHIEKGMLFTAKESLLRPGKASLDYIAGKRIRYYNVFYLILIAIGVMLFTRHMGSYFGAAEHVEESKKVYLNEASRKMDEIFAQKSKVIFLLFVPFAAINSFLLFRKRRLNLSEHAILSGMILLGLILISILTNLYFPINNLLGFSGDIASWVVTAVMLGYVGFAYVNAFGKDYPAWQVALRVILFFVLLSLEVLLLFLLVFGLVSDWHFGAVSITPFG